jgi:hypothetical protein
MDRWGVAAGDTLDFWISAGREATTAPPDGKTFPEIDPTGCGLAQATSWQYSFNKTLEWQEDDPVTHKTRTLRFNPVDLNSSIYLDPGWGE